MQKAFIFILFMWNSSTATSQDVTYLQFSLGCQVVIPCQNNRVYSNLFKWLYKRETHGEEKTLLVMDKGGLTSHGDTFRHQVRIGDNGSLIINSFTEDYEGLYWCVPVNCDPYNCRTDVFRIIRVKKEILNETFKTVHVSAGDTFAYKCPGEFPNTRWTFETRNNSSFRNLREVTSNKSIHIVNVTTKDAGKYTCSVSKCNRPFVKLLTVTLCVTERQCKNLSDSCPVCDSILNNTELHNVTNEHSCGSLNCSSDQSTDFTSHTSNNSPASHEHQMTIIYATLGAFVCLIFMALISYYLRLKLRAARRRCPSCFGIDVEEEASVVYSSIIIRRPAPTTNNHIPTCTQEDCVYSELKSFQ